MEIKTENFGNVPYQEQDVINFPEGLPGFTKLSKFIIIEMEELGPFCYLQSVEKSEVSFVIVDPKKFKTNYRIEMGIEDLSIININNSEQADIYSLVTLGDTKENCSMNLKAPIIINADENIGAQIILRNSDYEIEFKMFQPESSRKKFANNRRYNEARA